MEGTWGRALVGALRVAGHALTCVKDGAIWVDDALLEHIIHRCVIPSRDQGGGLGVQPQHVVTMA